jgi:hypothetical protein
MKRIRAVLDFSLSIALWLCAFSWAITAFEDFRAGRGNAVDVPYALTLIFAVLAGGRNR